MSRTDRQTAVLRNVASQRGGAHNKHAADAADNDDMNAEAVDTIPVFITLANSAPCW